MTIPTVQQLQEALTDINDLESFINGSTPADITTRLGTTYPNLLKTTQIVTAGDATGVGFDNNNSWLSSLSVQAALDELANGSSFSVRNKAELRNIFNSSFDGSSLEEGQIVHIISEGIVGLGNLYRLDSNTDSNAIVDNDDTIIIINSEWYWQSMHSLRADVTVTVGASGDFSTINEAIKHLSIKYPSYVNPRPDVVINLLSGFVMAEQVLVWGIDLSWIRITGVDAETSITNSALTESPSTGADNYSATYKPAFGVYAGGSGPKIDQMFDMGYTAQDPNLHNVGVLCYGPGSSIEVGRSAGIRRCGWYGILANLGGRVLAYESDFRDSFGRGMFANEGSFISARESNASGASSTAYHSSDGSQINAEQADGSNSQIGFSANNGGRINCKNGTATGCQEGVYASNGGDISAESVDASGATGGNGVGIRAFQGGRIDATGADAGNADNFGISIEHGSWCNARNADAQKASNPASTDVRILGGSCVNFDGGTGGTSETVNTLTANGIIYQ